MISGGFLSGRCIWGLQSVSQTSAHQGWLRSGGYVSSSFQMFFQPIYLFWIWPELNIIILPLDNKNKGFKTTLQKGYGWRKRGFVCVMSANLYVLCVCFYFRYASAFVTYLFCFLCSPSVSSCSPCICLSVLLEFIRNFHYPALAAPSVLQFCFFFNYYYQINK